MAGRGRGRRFRGQAHHRAARRQLSLQYHRGRDEHWIVVAGQARVTRGDAQLDLGANETVFIPNGAKHRIENIGASDLVFVEVQMGDLLDEADIVRIEDDYQRA